MLIHTPISPARLPALPPGALLHLDAALRTALEAATPLPAAGLEPAAEEAKPGGPAALLEAIGQQQDHHAGTQSSASTQPTHVITALHAGVLEATTPLPAARLKPAAATQVKPDGPSALLEGRMQQAAADPDTAAAVGGLGVALDGSALREGQVEASLAAMAAFGERLNRYMRTGKGAG